MMTNKFGADQYQNWAQLIADTVNDPETYLRRIEDELDVLVALVGCDRAFLMLWPRIMERLK
jgi:hypothetical protein